MTILRVLPQVKHLRHGGDAEPCLFQSKIRIDGTAAGLHAIIAAQIEHSLVIADASVSIFVQVFGTISHPLSWANRSVIVFYEVGLRRSAAIRRTGTQSPGRQFTTGACPILE